eukprot:TRINITY_DN57616_c0_g1_i1.p1 TRINITY_DN57616_c0_g1~~TRINITY_DN57616_c0_g1_i1.p1  ORF type:complete len:340 (-),score=77.46 TRINITY_DN57616_c0_g1_i1:317-1336(-)
MGKKKDKLAAKAAAEKKQDAEASSAKPAAEAETRSAHGVAPLKVVPKKEVCEHAEDVYHAAAVAFFTRDECGAVCKVLVAYEDRKIRAFDIGLQQPGKVNQRMLIFPMGRREKKDKNDGVETAKREYVEETGDYGGLSKYLDFADFEGAASEDEATDSKAPIRDEATWTGTGNMALYFAPAGMIALFCEVPAKAAKATHRAAVGGVAIKTDAQAPEKEKKIEKEASAETGDGEPQTKKRKKQQAANEAAVSKPSPSFHVGKTDHLEPTWIDISVLREAMLVGGRAPPLKIPGEEQPSRIFPTMASILRLPEAREWLGLPAASVSKAQGTPAASDETNNP